MKEILWVKSKHGRIYTEIEGESKTAVLFFYGLFDSIDNSNSKLIKNNLIKNNISTISFDYIGHGKSEEDINKISTSRILSDIDNIMSHIKNKFSKIFIYGNSFGGYLGIIASSRYKFIYGLILLNPVSNMIELLLRKQSEEELSKNTNKHNEINLFSKFIFFIDLFKYNIYLLSKKITCPVLHFHSVGDKMVPFKQSKKLNKNIESKKRFYPLKSDLHTLSDEKIKKFIIPKIEEFIVKN